MAARENVEVTGKQGRLHVVVGLATTGAADKMGVGAVGVDGDAGCS